MQTITTRLLPLLDQAIVSGGNFALGVLLARWLGLEAFGEYSLLWMGVLFLLSLHQAYLTQPLMTLFSGKKEEAQAGYLHGLYGLQAWVSGGLFAVSGLGFFLMKYLPTAPQWAGLVPVCGLLTSAYLLQDFLRKIFFVKKQARQPLLMDAALYGSMFAGLFALQAFGRLDLEAAVWAMLPAYLLSNGAGIFYLRKTGLFESFTTIKTATVKAAAREHYHFSFWLLGTSLVQWFSGNFFLVAAAGVLGTVAVGALRMAQNMVGLCHVLFLAMENVMPAEAARRFFSEGKDAMTAYLRRAGLLAGIPVTGLLAVLTLLSPWLIGMLYGAEYQSFSWLVGAYSVLYVFVYLGFPLRFALRTLQRTSPIFIAYSLSAVVSLVSAFPMTKFWGAGGVVAGLIGTQVLTLGVYVYFIRKNFRQAVATG